MLSIAAMGSGQAKYYTNLATEDMPTSAFTWHAVSVTQRGKQLNGTAPIASADGVAMTAGLVCHKSLAGVPDQLPHLNQKMAVCVPWSSIGIVRTAVRIALLPHRHSLRRGS